MDINIPDFVINVIKKSITKTNKFHILTYQKLKTSEVEQWFNDNPLYTAKIVAKFITQNITTWPTCSTCGNLLNENSILKNYTYCSCRCSANSKTTMTKRKTTNKERYGVDHVLQSDEFKNKTKATNLQRYGDEIASRSNIVKEKIKNTNLNKYGVICTVHSEAIKNKVKATNIERYGHENAAASQEIKEKIKRTFLEKYGVDNSLKSPEVRKKALITHRKKYYNKFLTLLNHKKISLNMPIDDYFVADNIMYKCQRCNTEFETKQSNPQKVWCPECAKLNGTSLKEQDVLNFIKEYYNGTIITHDRSILGRKELDIYIPEKKLAIEFNGSYWHSENFIDSTYHQEKTLMCKEKGIRLIHVSEHDWNNKQEIVKSIISSALGIYNQKIYARKCTLQEIDAFEYRNFLELNHIQGSINSKYKYGLFYQGELVSVFGYGQSRFKKGELELHRFCSKIYTQIVGGFSKFLKNIVNAKLYSYVDLSYFDGSGYFKNGFVLEGITKPSYVYIKENEILSRIQCQKHKLEKILENFDENDSEHLNMLNNGYVRFYDCGNLKVSYRND